MRWYRQTCLMEIKPPCTACAKAGLFLCRKTWMEGVRANTPTHEYVWAIKATTFDHVWSSEIGYVHLNWKRKHMFAMQIAKSEYTTNSNNTRRSREREENITRWYIFTGYEANKHPATYSNQIREVCDNLNNQQCGIPKALSLTG